MLTAKKWLEGIELADDAEPKGEIMLFPFGEFDHPAHGKLKFDNDFFNDIIDNYEADVLGANKPFMDKEHKMGEALAWFDTVPFIRQGVGLFAKPDYTELGEKLLGDRVYKFFSPWFEDFTDPETKRVFKNVWRGGAATNIPFLKTMPSLVDEIQLSETVDIKLSELSDLAEGESEDSTPSTEEAISNIKKEQSMKKFAELLGLDAKATDEQIETKLSEVLEAFNAMKVKLEEAEKPVEKPVDEPAVEKPAEDSEVKKELEEVKLRLAKRDCDDALRVALDEGKIIPTQKEYYEKRFLSDPVNVAEDLKQLNTVVNLSEIGSGAKGAEVSSDSPGVQLSEKANKLKVEKGISFDEAFKSVSKDNPELLKAYIGGK